MAFDDHGYFARLRDFYVNRYQWPETCFHPWTEIFYAAAPLIGLPVVILIRILFGSTAAMYSLLTFLLVPFVVAIVRAHKITDILIIWIICSPFLYAYGGNITLFCGMLTSFFMYIIPHMTPLPLPFFAFPPPPQPSRVEVFTGSLAGGFAIGIIIKVLLTSTPDFFIGLVYGLTLAGTIIFIFSSESVIARPFAMALKTSIKLSVIIFLSVLLIYLLALYFNSEYAYSLAIDFSLMALGALVSAIPTALIVILLVRAIHLGLREIHNLKPYFQALSIPLAGFISIYFSIALYFSGCYWLSYEYLKNGIPDYPFKGLSDNPNFYDFFYYSVVTITTLGYGDIHSTSIWTKSLSILEVIVGLGWITVGFAAILVYLQPQFTSIAAQQRRGNDKTGTDKRDMDWL